MAIPTLKERTAKIATLKERTSKLTAELLHTVDAALREAVAARRESSPEARCSRISAASHVERALRLAGRGPDDLKALEQMLREAPHRFAATRDALHQAEKAIEGGSWRITPPLHEDALLRAIAVQCE